MNADRIAEVYYGTHGGAEQQRRARQRIHWMCAAVRGQDVLDLGCSQGIASLLLGREGRRVVGIDRERQAVEYAQGLLQDEEDAVKERVLFQTAEAGDLPFKADSFDSILLGEVLEHQVDPVPVLEEARRCLRTDGVLVVTTPYGVFPYHDHKEPVYLGPLLEVLGRRFSVLELDLIESYLGLVAKTRRGNARRFDPSAALRVAEDRLRHQDETVWRQRASIAEQDRAVDALQQEVAELRPKAAERDQFAEHVERERAKSADREKLALELGQLRPLATERDKLRREVEDLRSQAAERERLQYELDELRHRAADRDAAVTDREVIRERLRETEARLKALDTEVREKTEVATRAQSSNSENERRAAALTLELERYKEQLKRREAELNSHRESLARTTELCEAANEEADDLRALQDQLGEALNRRTAEATRRVLELDAATKRAEHAAAEAGELRRRVPELEQRLLEQETALNELREESLLWQADKSELTTRIGVREAELEQLRTRRNRLTTSRRLRPWPTHQDTTEVDATRDAPSSNGEPSAFATAVDEALEDPAQPPLTAAEAAAASDAPPKDAGAWHRLAEVRLREKDLDGAAQAALTALDLEPTSRAAIWLAARTLALLAPDTRFGDVMDRLGPLFQLDDETLIRARDLAVEAGDHQRVLALAAEATRRDLVDPGWISNVAFAHWEVEDEAVASRLIEQMVGPDASEQELRAGARYFLRLNDAAAADTILRRMSSPDLACMLDLGRVLHRAGRLEEALTVFDVVLALDPTHRAATRARRLSHASLVVTQDRWASPARASHLTRTPRRVLHLLERTFPHHQAGSTVRTHAIGRAQLDAGLDVHMVTQPHFPWNNGVAGAAELDVIDGVHYHRLRDPEGGRKGLLDEQLRKYTELAVPLVEELQPAALHPASTFLNALVALELGKRFEIPVVYEVRGFPEERIVARRHTRVRVDTYRVRRDLERRCWERADHITTLAEVMKRHIVDHGISADKVTVVPNAVDSTSWTPAPGDPALAAKLGLHERTTVVGYISTFAPYEGIEYLLDAVRILRERGNEVHCLLVGDGQERRFLEQTAHALGVGEHVTFTGVVPHTQVKSYYALIDVFVVPRTNERVCNLVTPLKPYEAMALERAVIVSGTTALQEMVVDGETGLHFEPEDAESLAERISLLIADPSLRTALGEAGREWVCEHRTWKRNAELYENVYRQLGVL